MTTIKEHGNFVGGTTRPAHNGAGYERRNPAAPDEIVGRFAASDEHDAAEAVAEARDAAADWAATPAPARGRILAAAARALEARLEVVAQDMAREMGKPIREARGETARGVAILDYRG